MFLDIQKFVDGIGDAMRDERSRYHLTLGNLIAALEGFPHDAVVKLSDNPDEYPRGADSYRGYYSDLAFKPSPDFTTVGELLAECRGALDATFEGYKGGDYVMGTNTPLWISDYGTSSRRAIVGIQMIEGRAVLLIKLVE
jgi:hypothetical protein